MHISMVCFWVLDDEGSPKLSGASPSLKRLTEALDVIAILITITCYSSLIIMRHGVSSSARGRS